MAGCRLMKKVVLACLAVVIAPILWLLIVIVRALPVNEGALPLAGPAAPVTIVRDVRGVPWIEAESGPDAYFALGFVHAQDRLFQMEMTRRTGQGRLSEVLGGSAVGTDKFMRTLGLYRLATNEAARMRPDVASVVDAYVAGINAFLAQNKNALPLEFTALWFTPEPWIPADALVWQKLMGLQLSGNWNEELLMAQLTQKLGPDRTARLFPDVSAAGSITLAERIPDYAGRLRAAMTDVVVPHLASNIWALAPSRTATGGAVLANDPHLNFGSPNLWYLAAVSYPGTTLVGATVPGVPFHLLGHNGSLAWGFTTTHGDTQDLFVETLLDDETYAGVAGPEAFEVRDEIIRVRFGDPVSIKVRASRRGPIISDLISREERAASGGDDTAVALSATLLSEDDMTFDAIYRMARTTNVSDFLAASANFQSPQQNVMFADSRGGIGYAVVGRIPIRRSADCRGLLPTSGPGGHCDWIGWVDAAERPQRLNPPGGVLINANNRITNDEYPHLIAAEWPESYRADRIESTIADRAGITLAETVALQMDQVSLMARHVMPVFMSHVDPSTAPHPELLDTLSRWDGDSGLERIEPLLFTVWLGKIKDRLLADELGDLSGEFFGDRPGLIASILTKDMEWCDDVSTPNPEACATQAGAAWQDAVMWIEERLGPDPTQWQWQRLHVADFRHPIFGAVAGLGDFGSFSIATGGDNATVNRGSPTRLSSRRPLRHRHGPGIRAVYDLADLSGSRFALAGGQSGVLGSPHFDDLLEDWRDGQYFEVRPPAAAGNEQRLILHPAR